MFASALPVTLARDRSVAATRRADLPGRQDQIDVRQNVVDSVGVMLDAARVHHHCCLCAAIHSGRLNDFLSRHAADLRGNIRRVTQRDFTRRRPIIRARVYECLIDQALLNQNVQHSVRHRDVSAGLQLQMQVALARRRRLTRIDDDPAAAIVTLLPQKFIEHGKSLGAV